MIVYSQTDSLPKDSSVEQTSSKERLLDLVGVMMMMTILVRVNFASVMMMMMVAMVINVIVTGVMMMVIMMIMMIFVSVNVTNVIRTMRRRRRMVRRMVRRAVRRRVIAIDFIASTSGDFSRCSRRKGGKNESNENFELHICLEY